MRSLSLLVLLCSFAQAASADPWRPGPGPGRPGHGPGRPGWNQPGRPLPPPPPVRPEPRPQPQGDLRGYCPDYDHSQFMIAKNFAYSGSGLNFDSDGATRWALEYNNSHACGTIQEFSQRYQGLRDYAYSGSYMNMDSNSARDYALQWVEVLNTQWISYWKETFSAVRDLFYSGSYFNDDSNTAVRAGRLWNERGCENAQAVAQIKQAYQREYQFAYSGSGLNYDSARAKAYAIDRIRYLSRCSDLFR